MNGATKVILCLIAALCLIQAGTAFTAKTPVISPSGDPNTGDTVTIDTSLTFPTTNGMTFDQDDDLLFTTDLDNAVWKFEISRDGVTDPATTAGGKSARVDGWVLSYKSGVDILLTVHLEGKAPNITSSPTITGIKIQEVDSSGNVVSGREFKKQITVNNPATLAATIQLREADLANLRKSLDEKIRIGVDTTEAEAKYKAAQTAIASAKSAPTASAGNTYLKNAQTYITEATTLADKAWAQHDLSAAEQLVKKVDGEIQYFSVNRSMGSDSRVAVIVSKYEAASTSLSTAKNTFNQGNYPLARGQAGETSNKAMEAFNLSTQLRTDIGEGGLSLNFLGGLIPYVVGILVIAAIAAGGYYLYKKKFKWDELG